VRAVRVRDRRGAVPARLRGGGDLRAPGGRAAASERAPARPAARARQRDLACAGERPGEPVAVRRGAGRRRAGRAAGHRRPVARCVPGYRVACRGAR
jgi:hypothetical protein